MSVLTFAVLPILITILSILFIYLSSKKYNYWLKKKVPHLKPKLVFGNYVDYILQRRCFGAVVKEICTKFPDEPYIGTYYGTEPALVVQDPKLLKLVFTKDFYFFNSRDVSDYVENETVTKGLFFNYGNNWKVMRQNLTPIFSTAKMKNMFSLVRKCAKVFEKLLEQETCESSNIEVRLLMGRYTMDSFGSCALGVDTNVMEKPVGNPFYEAGNSIFEISFIRGFKWVSRSVWPSIFYGFGFKVFPDKLSKFFENLIVNGYENRNKKANVQTFADLVFSLKENKYIVGDSIKNSLTGDTKKVSVEATNEVLSAICVGLFGAGYDTSASALSHTLFELAKHPEVQEKAIENVDQYLRDNDNKLSYECITQQLPYVEACINEALRLHSIGVITREVTEDYTFPTGLTVEKGMKIQIPVCHIHRHPDYFPNPDEYRPERFYADEKKKILPYTYMPFGEGPRICIGMRFAKIQMLAGLVTIFKKYRVVLADGMPQQLEYEPRAFVTRARGGINLKFIPRDDTLCPNFA